MGMSIDETIEILHGRDKCMEYVTDNDSEAFEMAISIIHKYQKIQEIVNHWNNTSGSAEESDILDYIEEVLKDGKI